MIIHQIWMQGADNVPDTYRAYADRLRRLNPTYEYRLWSKEDLERACAEIGPRHLKAFRTCRFMHQQIDFGRYCIVYLHGGITVDMDAEPLRPFDPLVARLPDHSLIVSQFPMNTLESSILSLRPQHWWLNNATLISKRPGNPACRVLVDKVADRILASRWWTTVAPQSVVVSYTTGPMFFMHVFRDLLEPGTFIVLPYKYLEPCSGLHSSCKVPQDAILNHKHDGTWLSGFHTTILKGYFHATDSPMMFLAIVSIVSILVALWRST